MASSSPSPSPSPARLRAFVREQTRLRGVPGVPGLRLHVADDVMALTAATGALLGEADPDLPYWAFPWAGGLGVAQHLLAHPAEVAGRRVLDVAAGSGLCGLVALAVGAAHVTANDVDPLAAAAARLNARANGRDLDVAGRDLTGGPAPDVDVILAGDVCYQPLMAGRILPWLARAAARGIRVLLGDPGRAYLPQGLELLGRYRVATSLELERARATDVAVYAWPAVRDG